MSVMEIPMSEEQEIEHMLARLLYVQYSTHLNKFPKPIPHVPAWGYTYAKTAMAYLGWNEDTLPSLREDYR